jgi:hypothetical protein
MRKKIPIQHQIRIRTIVQINPRPSSLGQADRRLGALFLHATSGSCERQQQALGRLAVMLKTTAPSPLNGCDILEVLG